MYSNLLSHNSDTNGLPFIANVFPELCLQGVFYKQSISHILLVRNCLVLVFHQFAIFLLFIKI